MDADQLITQVFERPAIWQSRHKLHHNRAVIEQLWDQVAAALNVNKDAARSRWKGLKDQYRKEVKKIMKNSSGSLGGKLKSSNWAYFSSLCFLNEEIMRGSFNQDYEQCDEQIFDEDYDPARILALVEGSHGNDDTSSLADGKENSQFERDTSAADTCSLENQALSDRLKPVQRKRKKSNHESDESALTDQQSMTGLSRDKTDTIEESEDYHFLMSILPHFKSMTPLKKLQVRKQITQVLIDAKLGESKTS